MDASNQEIDGGSRFPPEPDATSTTGRSEDSAPDVGTEEPPAVSSPSRIVLYSCTSAEHDEEMPALIPRSSLSGIKLSGDLSDSGDEDNERPARTLDHRSPIEVLSPDTDDSDDDNEEPPPLDDNVQGNHGDDESVQDDHGDDHEDSSCPGCAFVDWFMTEELPNVIEANGTEANAECMNNAQHVINDSREKFLLYRGHRIWVVNQQEAISQCKKNMQQQCLDEKGGTLRMMVTADFKMKWEPKYAREKTSENFGKRGISWHGCLIVYYLYDSATNTAIRYVVKLDQILEGTNKQDGAVLLALLESAMTYIKQEFPDAKQEVILQSDNAGCYHAKEVVIGIAVINAVSQLRWAGACNGGKFAQHDTKHKLTSSYLLCFLISPDDVAGWRPSNHHLCSH
jgi:hypothetical protein